MVQLLLAVAIRPPQPWICNCQLSKFCRGELDFALARLELDLFCNRHPFKFCLQGPLRSRLSSICQRNCDFHLRARCVRQRKRRDDLRIADLYGIGRAQSHRLPDAGIAIANGWDPVPALCSNKRGAVEAHEAAVLARASLD